jgi:hypothetical protein
VPRGSPESHRRPFKPEGAWREMIHRDGRRFDVLHYGLLRHEWQALHA